MLVCVWNLALPSSSLVPLQLLHIFLHWFHYILLHIQLLIPSLIFRRLRDRDIAPCNFLKIKKAISQCFSSTSFIRSKDQDAPKEALANEAHNNSDMGLKLFLVPSKGKDSSSRPQYESHVCALWKLRDQVLFCLSVSDTRISIMLMYMDT